MLATCMRRMRNNNLETRIAGSSCHPQQWCECYARCDWSLPMIYWSTDTLMTSPETCFLCFVQHGARFWKCLWDYFGLKQVKASTKTFSHLQTSYYFLIWPDFKSHMQMQTCQVSWLCHESHDFTTYLTLSRVGNWFVTPSWKVKLQNILEL